MPERRCLYLDCVGVDARAAGKDLKLRSGNIHRCVEPAGRTGRLHRAAGFELRTDIEAECRGIRGNCGARELQPVGTRGEERGRPIVVVGCELPPVRSIANGESAIEAVADPGIQERAAARDDLRAIGERRPRVQCHRGEVRPSLDENGSGQQRVACRKNRISTCRQQIAAREIHCVAGTDAAPLVLHGVVHTRLPTHRREHDEQVRILAGSERVLRAARARQPFIGVQIAATAQVDRRARLHIELRRIDVDLPCGNRGLREELAAELVLPVSEGNRAERDGHVTGRHGSDAAGRERDRVFRAQGDLPERRQKRA